MKESTPVSGGPEPVPLCELLVELELPPEPDDELCVPLPWPTSGWTCVIDASVSVPASPFLGGGIFMLTSGADVDASPDRTPSTSTPHATSETTHIARNTQVARSLTTNIVEHRRGWRTEYFKELGHVARQYDEECWSIVRRSNAARWPNSAERRREPTCSVL
jgi:hypothetical protein